MNIQGKLVTLRAIEETDLDSLQRWANDPVTQDGIGEIHFPSSREFHLEWFRNLRNDRLNQRFVVDVNDVGIIGISSIVDIDWRNGHAWHGLVLGESGHRGKGYGTDAVMATMRYAFDELNLHRLDGSMIEYNEASLAMYTGKLGWKHQGRRTDYFYRKGRYWDQIMVGLTKEDYEELITTTRYWDN